jgi:hypothetical protein
MEAAPSFSASFLLWRPTSAPEIALTFSAGHEKPSECHALPPEPRSKESPWPASYCEQLDRVSIRYEVSRSGI